MSVRDKVGAERYDNVKATLEKCWPDEKARVTDALVDELFCVAKHQWSASELATVDLPEPTDGVAANAPPASAYYLGMGTHTRHTAPGHQFTGKLPMVRISLPKTGTTANTPDIQTAGGECLTVDRLFASIEVLWARYRHDPKLTFECPERVDLITPPRLGGGRFAAIAIYLCYAKADDDAPSFYVLEAGLATGQPRIAYLGRTMDTMIETQSNYHPTPFSGPHHYYRGWLAMCPGRKHDPLTLTVQIFGKEPPEDHYMTVAVEYELRDAPVMTKPFHLTIAAGARLTAIADALGISIELPQQWVLRLFASHAMDSLFTVRPQPVTPG